MPPKIPQTKLNHKNTFILNNTTLGILSKSYDLIKIILSKGKICLKAFRGNVCILNSRIALYLLYFFNKKGKIKLDHLTFEGALNPPSLSTQGKVILS